MSTENNKPIGYWLFESSSPGGSWFPKSSFTVFSKNGIFWAGSLIDDYSMGNFEIDENDIIASDPDYGDLKEFKYQPEIDQLNQHLSSNETGRGPAIVTFKRVSADDFKSIAIKHLCRIKGLGKTVATKLVDSQVLFVIEIIKWSDKEIENKSSELDLSIEILKNFRKAAKEIS